MAMARGNELPKACSEALDRFAESYYTKRRYETDDELRARIRGQMMHVGAAASMDHMDWVVTETIRAHAPLPVDDAQIKAQLARRWLREERAGLSWWDRLRFWWRLWRTK